MSKAELNLYFPDPNRVIVRYGDQDSAVITFRNPFSARNLGELRWYLESYAAHCLGDPDDKEAQRIAAQLPKWGAALFGAVFGERSAQRLFNQFQDATQTPRTLTITALHSEILSLPWELLRDPAGAGAFLFNETPRISIRRSVAGALGGRPAVRTLRKRSIHILFVVSRPAGAGWLDPRRDPIAILDALEAGAPGRCTWEFLCPPTLDALIRRLDDDALAHVDVLHFDGHGVFDVQGGLPELLEARRVTIGEILAGQGLREGSSTARVKASPANTGYLLFEKGEGEPDLVCAEKLGFNLNRRSVSLVVLSACESAAHTRKGEPLGSLAARLTASGLPAVIAMTHAVLACTTCMLFGEFYRHLGRGTGIGIALDAARLKIYNNPQKYQLLHFNQRRGSASLIWLELQDWFVPTLYQAGRDVPLLRAQIGRSPTRPRSRSNVPESPEAGFFGRSRELWSIWRWFAGPTRRVTLTGLRGQGRTALAQEAARWLIRIGQFQAAVFIDLSIGERTNAVSMAGAAIGAVLGKVLTDSESVAAALGQTPTLVILDGLEKLSQQTRRKLLDAAISWSHSGQCRVLLTACSADFGHDGYATSGTLKHRTIQLGGLGTREEPDDALEWFAKMAKLPPAANRPLPTHNELVEVFDQIRFNPMLIRLMAEQLKRHPAEEVLEGLRPKIRGNSALHVKGAPCGAVGLYNCIAASLKRLDEQTRRLLPRFSIFAGEAFEPNVLVIAALGWGRDEQQRLLQDTLHVLEQYDTETARRTPDVKLAYKAALSRKVRRRWAQTLRRDLAHVPARQNVEWETIQKQLQEEGLLQVDHVPEVEWRLLRFHPALTPVLWGRLATGEAAQLMTAYWHCYSRLAEHLYEEDARRPHEVRTIVRLELPNLLLANELAFAAGVRHGIGFAICVYHFVRCLGAKSEASRLRRRAAAAARGAGSRAWYLMETERGCELLAEGHASKASAVFERVFFRLNGAGPYDCAATLFRLGQCLEKCGRTVAAKKRYSQALAICGRFPQSEIIKRLVCRIHTRIGQLLLLQGQYRQARKAYAVAFELAGKARDIAFQATLIGSIGRAAALERNWTAALQAQRVALALSQLLRDVRGEWSAWFELGKSFQRSKQWAEAELHYRQSIRVAGRIGDDACAAHGWMSMAGLCLEMGRRRLAEHCYRRVITAGRNVQHWRLVSDGLQELALMLHLRAGRLGEARSMADEALAMEQRLEPAAREISPIHDLLGKIIRAQAAVEVRSGPKIRLLSEAQKLRRRARIAQLRAWNATGELKTWGLFIIGVVAACCFPKFGKQVEKSLSRRPQTQLAAATLQIIGGSRRADLLCEQLDLGAAVIVEAILATLANPNFIRGNVPRCGGKFDPEKVIRSWRKVIDPQIMARILARLRRSCDRRSPASV
jgi:tetratricopeptide (TPR) repeat protein